MAKGIIYLMNTCVDGLVKIGRTGVDNFEQRMAILESNGYRRISVLTREFAIEVEDYEEKEKLLHELFSKSRVGNSELFSIDINLVKQLMSSLEGKVIYPKDEKKEEIFVQATEVVADFVNNLSEELINILKDLNDDKTSFEKMGITYERCN